jgi:tetratricopeptide (TPR) repeat protein
MTRTEQRALLRRIADLESTGRHAEAIRLCEAALTGNEPPEIHLALARNRFALASRGEDSLARPALEAALTGIARRCANQPDLQEAIQICRTMAARLGDPHPSSTPHAALLAQALELELSGRHREALELCESAIGKGPDPDINLALARNAYSLAAAGNEMFAWPALFAALDGIQQLHPRDGHLAHIIGICRWVLDLFADPHRLKIRRFTEQSHARSPVDHWWADGLSLVKEEADGTPLPTLDELAAMRDRGDHVGLCNALLAAAPTFIRYGRDSAGIAREAAYLLSCVATSIAGEQVNPLLATDDFPLPGDYEGQVYDRYLLIAARVRHQRLRSPGVPAILLTAIPKSASEFLSSTLSEVIQAPIVRVTIGDPFLGTVNPRWVAEAARGCCVLHDHFAASEINLATLRAVGTSPIHVLVRDPRAVFSSLDRMQGEYDGKHPTDRRDGLWISRGVKLFADWIDTWVQAEEAGFPVRFIRFQDLTTRPAEIMGEVLDASGATRYRPRLQEILLEREARSQKSSNFRTGHDNAWRTGIPSDLHDTIWSIISPGVKKLLALEP